MNGSHGTMRRHSRGHSEPEGVAFEQRSQSHLRQCHWYKPDQIPGWLEHERGPMLTF